ncbi:organic cation transporter protein-like [Ylistrum balloti]|uniref:organic cation transporter protein-like n=1 Tax=Ylistrum balloti TaxID=509963 RepID=UPI002905C904|nr:organic cation transporter protein-like [Ylistrum balloti]
MDFDAILEKLGDFGRYQKWLYSLICISSAFVGLFAVISAILLGTPEHRCKIPGYDNDTYHIQNDDHLTLINKFIPPSSDETYLYDQCHLFVYNVTSVTFDNSSHPINATKIQCTEWVYSDDVFKETFTSKHNLVCDDSNKPPLSKSLFFVGILIGAFTFGNLSDGIGRKKTFYIGVILMLASTLALAFSPNYIAFAIFMTAIGATTQGVFLVGFVIGMELVGPTKRTFAGIVSEYFFALGLIILSGIAYLIRHWKYIEIACAAPFSIILTYWWLLPESPRWLITKHRYEEAKVVLQKVAKVNKVVLNDNLLQVSDKETDDGKQNDGRVWQLFTSRVLCLRTLVIFVNWCMVTMAYYGLSLNSGNLGGNYFLNFFLSGLVEFPAYTLVMLLVDRVGRKWLHCISMIMGGLFCLSTIFPILYLDKKYQPLTTTLAMLGKLGAAAAFAIIYMYSAELFPTVVRNAGMGASSCVARLGAIAAPFIADSGDKIGGKMGKAFPLVVFGVATIVAGVLALHLPETLNQDLPETLEDGILFGTSAYKSKKKDETTLATINTAYVHDDENVTSNADGDMVSKL